MRVGVLREEVVANGVLRAGFFRNVDDGLADRHAGVARGAEVVEVIGDLVKLLRADDEVDIGELVEERGAAVLRHAAEDAEDKVGLLLFAGLEVAGFADGFLLGGVADGAGVEEEDVAVVFVGDDAITAGTQHSRDGFAVALVHLAAVGFDVNPVHVRSGPR